MVICDKADSVAPAQWWSTGVIEEWTFKPMQKTLEELVERHGCFSSFEAIRREVHQRLKVVDDWELPSSPIPEPQELADQKRIVAVLPKLYEYLERAKGLYRAGDEETALAYVRWFEVTVDVVGQLAHAQAQAQAQTLAHAEDQARRRRPTKRTASAGGMASSVRYNAIRDRLVELIVQRRPREGWRSKSQVARAVSMEMAEAYKAAGMEVPKEIEPAIRRWISEYPPARSAYCDTQQAGCRRDSIVDES